MRTNAWYHVCWPPLISLAAVTVWLWPIALGNQPGGGEIASTHLPLMVAYGDALKAGRLPLWNELDGFGSPLLAEGQIGVLYPPHLVLYRLLDARTAYSVSMVFHFWLAAWFAYLCGRGFQLGHTAAALSALIFVGQGFYVVHLAQPWSYTAGCWLPLAVLACRHWMAEGRWRWLFGLSLVVVAQLLAGHFQIAFYTLVVIMVMGLVILTRAGANWKLTTARFAALVVAAILGLAGAAAQLLPTAELLAVGDARGFGEDYVSSFAMPPAGLLNFFAPALFQHPFWESALWVPQRSSPQESLPYVGLLSLGLAGWALIVGRREPRVQLWGVLVCLSGLLCLGPAIPGFELLASGPGFGWFSAPARWSLVCGLFLGLLAGRGLEGLRVESFPRWCWSYALVVAIVLILGTVAGHRWLQSAKPPVSDALFILKLLAIGYQRSNIEELSPARDLVPILQRELMLPAAHLLVLLSLGFSASLIDRTRRLIVLAFLWIALDLHLTGRILSPVQFLPHGSIGPSPVLKACADLPGRVAGTTGRLAMSVGARPLATVGAPDMAAYWHLARRDVAHLFPESLPTVPPAARFSDAGIRLARDAWLMTEDDVDLFRLADVRTLIVAHGTGDYEQRQRAARQRMFPNPETGPLELVRRENDPALSVQIFGRGILKLDPTGIQWSIWKLPPALTSARAWVFPVADPAEPGTDPRLFRMPPPARRKMLDSARPAERVLEEGERMVIQAQAQSPSVLVLSDLYYPGWEAELRRGDHAERLKIEPAFGHWRAVYLPEPGDYEVTFRYRPRSFRVGWQISLTAAGVWFCAAVLVWVSTSHSTRSPQ